MNVGIYRSPGDPRGRFVWGNSSLVEILGYPSFETLRQIAVTDIFTDPDGRKTSLRTSSGLDLCKQGDLYETGRRSRICVSVTALAKFDPARQN